MLHAMDLGLAGKGVLVTGGAGGIGAATVRAFAAEGARVAIHYRTSGAEAERLAAETGGIALQADLTDEAAADALVPAAVEALGRLDVCVANAGVWSGDSVPVVDMSIDRFRHVVDGNLTATFLTCRAYLRHVREVGEGSIVMVGSTSGIFGEEGNAEYAAVKSGICFGLARSLKNEIVRFAPRGRVNVVAPGWTVTPMVGDLLDERVPRPRHEHLPAAQGGDARGLRGVDRLPLVRDGRRAPERPGGHRRRRHGRPPDLVTRR